MVPWVYEFHWTAFHVTFLLIFFTVFVTVAATIIIALRRTQQDEQQHRMESIQWHSDFEDLAPAMKVCRHELNGDVQHRVCDNEFDCRSCTLHPVFSARKKKGSLLQYEVYGFSMPPYRLYHRGHTWVQQEDDGTFKVGIDDFGSRIIGRPHSIELPPIGSHLSVNGRGILVRRSDSTIRLLSPIDGEVIGHGNSEKGWYLKVRADNPERATTHLLKAEEVPNWILREMERLQFSFATSGVGATLADGGELVPDFHKHFPKADWDSVLGQMFLEA
ncbi:MAG: glycine cleavage system protein H [Bacteroidetes bacterium]|nr:glycine cleavage system protein H [Bacteroidota bacterium]